MACPTRHTLVGFGATYASIDLKLDPLGAYSLLGMPVSELAGRVRIPDRCVRASGDRAGRPDCASCLDWDERFDVLEAFLLGRLADGPRPDPAVAWAWRRLCETSGRIRVARSPPSSAVAGAISSARFGAQIGLAPKTAARLIRFADVRRRIERDPARWAEIAYAAGYADQSHLIREFRQLAGTTPSDFVARHAGGGSSGRLDGLTGATRPFPFVQASSVSRRLGFSHGHPREENPS